MDLRNLLPSDGMAEHLELQERLLDKGCFGVPTFLVDDEVYFGREHLAGFVGT